MIIKSYSKFVILHMLKSLCFTSYITTDVEVVAFAKKDVEVVARHCFVMVCFKDFCLMDP